MSGEQIALYRSPQRIAFDKFHAENPHVYRLFVRFALQAIESGRPRFSARMIGERMRWYTMIETTDRDFKLGNNCLPFYVRIFEADYPDHAGLFSKRRALADE